MRFKENLYPTEGTDTPRRNITNLHELEYKSRDHEKRLLASACLPVALRGELEHKQNNNT